MITPLSETAEATVPGILINITGPNGYFQEHVLTPGDALVVGASPACGARIEGPGVAAMHCTISSEEGQLVIDDWDTGAGTCVDGQRIARQAIVAPGSTITIGAYQLELRLRDSAPSPATADVPASREVVAPPVVMDVSPATSEPEELPVTEAPTPMEICTDESQPSVDDIWDSPVSSFCQSTADDLQPTYDEPTYELLDDDTDSVVSQDDTTELLRIELDFLRTELADRDARVAELEQSLESGSTSDNDDLPSREEVETLAGRLEELLEELDQSDERLTTMSEMLRLSEEANAATEEERTQMESWIGEVERRVGNWEEEWHAERNSLNKRIAELTAQRDDAESQGTSRESSELIHQLRQQITSLEAETERLKSEKIELQQRMETADLQSEEERIAAAVDEAMREERLQFSQERAEFARERADMMRRQEEVASREGAQSADIADLKIRAFRQHLKEVRENAPSPRPAPTMSQRLGKLWRKIDGRPLDTD